MEHTKDPKEILLEEINNLNHLIEETRRAAKDCSQYRERLAELIVELSKLPQGEN